MNVLGFMYGRYRDYTVGEKVEIVNIRNNMNIAPYKVGDVCTVIKTMDKEKYATLCGKRECNNSSIKQCIGMKSKDKDEEVWICYCDIVPYRKRDDI